MLSSVQSRWRLQPPERPPSDRPRSRSARRRGAAGVRRGGAFDSLTPKAAPPGGGARWAEPQRPEEQGASPDGSDGTGDSGSHAARPKPAPRTFALLSVGERPSRGDAFCFTLVTYGASGGDARAQGLSPVTFTLTDQPVSLSGRGRCWKRRRHRGGRLSRHPSRPSTSRRLLCVCPALACALAVGWPWAGLSLAHACAGKAGRKGRGSRRPSWMSPLGTGFSMEASGPCVSTDRGAGSPRPGLCRGRWKAVRPGTEAAEGW